MYTLPDSGLETLVRTSHCTLEIPMWQPLMATHSLLAVKDAYEVTANNLGDNQVSISDNQLSIQLQILASPV